MDVTEVLQKATPEEYAEVMSAATPVERVLFAIAREGGVQLLTSEMAPSGLTLLDALHGEKE